MLGWSSSRGPLHQAKGQGSGVRVEQQTELEWEFGRVIISRAYPIGIDQGPNITEQACFHLGHWWYLGSTTPQHIHPIECSHFPNTKLSYNTHVNHTYVDDMNIRLSGRLQVLDLLSYACLHSSACLWNMHPDLQKTIPCSINISLSKHPTRNLKYKVEIPSPVISSLLP